MTAIRLMACALVAMISLGVGTADAQGIKIAVVNFGRLLDEAPQAQESQRDLQEEFAPRQRDIRGREDQFKSMEERLQQGDGFMGEEERRELERQARDLQRDLNRSKTKFAEDLSLRRNEELGQLQRMLIGEVQNYGRAQSFDIVMSEAVGVVYASTSVDITDQILSALKARHSSGQGGE